MIQKNILYKIIAIYNGYKFVFIIFFTYEM